MLLVFAFHFRSIFLRDAGLHHSGRDVSSTIMFIAGPYGTNLLLALSGYFAHMSLARMASARVFVLRRFLRLQIPLAIVLAVYVLVSVAIPQRSKLSINPLDALAQIVPSLLLVHGFVNSPPIITVAWTISYIFLFTVVLAMAFRVLQLSRWPNSAALSLYAAGAIWTATCTPFPRLTLLVIGAAAAHARLPVLTARAKAIVWAAAVVASAGVMVLCLDSAFVRAPELSLYVIPTAVLIFAVAPPPVFQRVSAFRGVTFIGTMSYSFYLLHSIALHLTREAANWVPVISPVLWFFVSLACATSLAWLFDRFIDRPLSKDPLAVIAAIRKHFLSRRMDTVPVVGRVAWDASPPTIRTDDRISG